ncbi:hypothetical protein [Methanosalsum natronophilum]|uniref:hypothetical protein n=1 Tax=Methanosalsum natronophilum TaxID=768733 RepID=UPI0021697877|nr:hypothetical protein [Methanosalsum natronophilum]MCS3923348.1 hypothetical protein [Methanosalsum natronophilum]
MSNKNIASTLGRPIDLNYLPNVLITLMTVLVLVGGTIFQLVQGYTFVESIVLSGQVGVTVFITWTILRELDPDHDSSALICSLTILILIIVDFITTPSIIPLLWLMLLFRIMNISTGLKPTFFDSTILFISGLALMWYYSWIYGPVLSAVYLIVSKLPGYQVTYLYYGLAGLLISLIYMLVGTHEISVQVDSMLYMWLISPLILIYLISIIFMDDVRSKNDMGTNKISSKSIQLTRLILLKVVLMSLIFYGVDGLVAVSPLIVGMVILSLYFLVLNVRTFSARIPI